jgi:pyruvate kinase
LPRTKIVCTIGPSSESREIIRELIQHGMNVARLNFSHGTHESHGEKIRIIREISEELHIPVAILQDLGGPKIRVGEVSDPGIALKPGQSFILTSEQLLGTEDRVSVSYHDLPLEVNEGDVILLSDGMMELVVKKTTESEIFCEVVVGGILTSHKGINLPTGTINVEPLTEKDRGDLIFGLDSDVDYVALSFVKTAEDILKVKDIIRGREKDTPVIAKIEKHEALNNIEKIMNAADGIMVARGDLGVEIPLENVPNIQKTLVSRANAVGKPVIIATQMLRSMVDSPRPTRAEAADVANAVLDGADAVMLSEETASGDYPVQALQFIARIAESAEEEYPHEKYLQVLSKMDVAASVAHASCILAEHLDATAIIATTHTGSTAIHISRFKPRPKIISLSPNRVTVRRLSLIWGCIPGFLAYTRDTDEMIENAAQSALKTGNVSRGDLVVITAGHPVWLSGTTNMMRVKKL